MRKPNIIRIKIALLKARVVRATRVQKKESLSARAQKNKSLSARAKKMCRISPTLSRNSRRKYCDSYTGCQWYDTIRAIKEINENIYKKELNEICEKFNNSCKPEIVQCINAQPKQPCQFYLSLKILSGYVEYNFDSSRDIQFDDLEIRKLFTGLNDIKYGNKNRQQLCEAILRVMCNAFKLSVAQIDKEFWFENLQTYYSNETNSEKIKFYSSYILINTEMAAPQLHRQLMHSFMNIKHDEDKSYFGLSEEEILSVQAIGIANHLKNYENSFTDDEKEPILPFLHQLSSNVIKTGYKQKKYYEMAITNYSMSTLRTFKERFVEILFNKLTLQTPLEDNEKTTLNIMCNAFTICGQFHASPLLTPYIDEIVVTTLKYLEILQPIANLDMIASRISEIILYCLCNITQDGKWDDRQGWRPILYKYYTECKYSSEIKIASAVSICLLLGNVKSQEEYKSEIMEIKRYLNDIKSAINKSHKYDYVGFTLKEIEEALAHCD